MASIAKVNFSGLSGTEGLDPISLGPGTYVLGRSSGNDVVIKKNDISRQHARIEVREEQLVITDLGSANGTKVNGHRLTEAVLVNHGDEVEFGDRKFRIEMVMGAEAAPAPGASPVNVAEETAIWTPPAGGPPAPPAPGSPAADSPVEATMNWEPQAEAPPLPPRPKAPSLEPTGDVPVEEPESEPETEGSSGWGLRILLISLILLVVVVVVFVAFRQRLAPGPSAEPVTVEYIPPPPLVESVERDIKAMTPQDQRLYERVVYFYEIRNFFQAKSTLATLARKYPQNGTLGKQLERMEQALENEINRLYREAEDHFRFLKYREARENYLAVIRLAPMEDNRRVAAERKVKEIDELLKKRRRF